MQYTLASPPQALPALLVPHTPGQLSQETVCSTTKQEQACATRPAPALRASTFRTDAMSCSPVPLPSALSPRVRLTQSRIMNEYGESTGAYLLLEVVT